MIARRMEKTQDKTTRSSAASPRVNSVASSEKRPTMPRVISAASPRATLGARRSEQAAATPPRISAVRGDDNAPATPPSIVVASPRVNSVVSRKDKAAATPPIISESSPRVPLETSRRNKAPATPQRKSVSSVSIISNEKTPGTPSSPSATRSRSTSAHHSTSELINDVSATKKRHAKGNDDASPTATRKSRRSRSVVKTPVTDGGRRSKRPGTPSVDRLRASTSTSSEANDTAKRPRPALTPITRGNKQDPKGDKVSKIPRFSRLARAQQAENNAVVSTQIVSTDKRAISVRLRPVKGTAAHILPSQKKLRASTQISHTASGFSTRPSFKRTRK